MSMEDIEKLKARVERDPDSKLFLPLAEEYRKAGMLDEAISVLLKGLERQPSYASARVALGKIYLEKKMIEDARKEFEKVIAAIPDNLFAHKKLAEIYRDIGEVDRAISEYKTVIQINPLDEDARSFIESIERSKEEIQVEALEEPLSEISTQEFKGQAEEGFEEIGSPEVERPLEETLFPSEEPSQEKLEEEFFGIPEDQVFDLSGGEPEEVLSEDMMEVRSPLTEIEGMEEQVREEIPEPFKEVSISEEESPYVEKIGKVIDFTEADGFVARGEYFKALDSYKLMLKDHPDNRQVLQRIAELRNLLKLLGKDEEIISKLQAFLEGVKRRRDEFFGLS